MTNQTQIERVAEAIAATAIDRYSNLYHALSGAPLIDGSASEARRSVDGILINAAKAAIDAMELDEPSGISGQLGEVKGE